MNRNARSVLRRIGHDPDLDDERQQHLENAAKESQDKQSPERQGQASGLDSVPEEDLSESEKRHEKYRRQQAMAGRFTPAVERLPIMTSEEREERDKNRPKWKATEFEGPLDKLIEKYGDLEEVRRHLTLGQSMKYEFTDDGQVLDKEGNIIFDGEKIVGKP